ncbi:type II secretion system F family protein [Candidatus Woesearchaeota archaeon]|nr:type II secretion system F family protein [Candidatus Woesearchaeota archaeon]
MAFQIIYLEEFGKAFVPVRVIPYLREYLLKAGITRTPYRFFGGLFYLSAIITGIIYLVYIYPFLSGYNSIVLLLASFLSWAAIQMFLAATFILSVYFYIDIRIFNRTRKMEELLPEFLQVVSSNLKGGMSFENSMWAAIKPQFSVLANEMAEVSKKVMTGYEIQIALRELADKYDSPTLQRTVDLVANEVEAGGNIADLLDRIVDNLRNTKELKADMSASAVTYVIFISVIVIVISPLLFALSFHLLIIILNFLTKLSAASSGLQTLPFKIGRTPVEPGQFKVFSIAAINIISLFSSIIVSIVEKGNLKSGLKYIPLYIGGSTFFYFVFMGILGSVFKTLA